MKNYAHICPNFQYYYPNGVPAYAQRRCLECINLDEKHLSKEVYEKQAYRCLLPDREKKKNAWKEAQAKGQRRLFADLQQPQEAKF
jgi:hypothetical protein